MISGMKSLKEYLFNKYLVLRKSIGNWTLGAPTSDR